MPVLLGVLQGHDSVMEDPLKLPPQVVPIYANKVKVVEYVSYIFACIQPMLLAQCYRRKVDIGHRLKQNVVREHP